MERNLANYQHRVDMAQKAYTIIGCFVIAFTLYMGTHGDVFTTSMSAMGNTGTGMHITFVIWTIVFCVYFGSIVGFILILTRNTRSRIRTFVYIAAAIMTFGDIMPFVPTEHPVAAWLHNTCAQIASVSLAVTLMLLALTIRRLFPEVFKKALFLVIMFWIVLLGLMGLFGTKAITEMTGIIGGILYLIVLAHWIVKAEQFDASAALSSSDAQQADEEATRLEKRARELEEEYMKAEMKARHARIAADELRRIERKHAKRAL